MTIAYALTTAKREQAEAKTSQSSQPPGVTTYVDIMQALVPAEVLTLHGVLIGLTTTSTTPAAGQQATTTISSPEPLAFAFWAMVVLSFATYVGTKYAARRELPRGVDLVRALIPPLAFVVWTALQRTTAFDAAFPGVDDVWRSVVAVIAAVVLGAVTKVLADLADERPPA